MLDIVAKVCRLPEACLVNVALIHYIRNGQNTAIFHTEVVVPEKPVLITSGMLNFQLNSSCK